MLTTPKLGLEYAQGTDPAKQYPAAVDGPSKLKIEAAIVAAAPSGIIQPYAGATAPSGWLICDGAAVSRTTYAALFAVCGVTYGIGDNSTTFNLPDLKGRTAIGFDGSDSSFNVRGRKAGNKGHVALWSNITGAAYAFKQVTLGANWTANLSQTVSSAAAGSSVAQPNAVHVVDLDGDYPLPPFITLTYLIKT